jgi:hypothetical protein
MAKIVRLTEQDLVRLVNRVINEQTEKEKGFVNNIKKRFISKGYTVKNYGGGSLLNMTKGKEYSVSIHKEEYPKKLVLDLSKHFINPETKKYEFQSINIDVVNYDESLNGGGPIYRYKVDYYGDGGKFIKTENLNGFQFGELLDNYK